MPAHILITGASGFVGGALLERLRGEGGVRALDRETGGLTDAGDVEVVEGDASDESVLAEALDGIEVAYYLLHSMDASAGDDFAERDRELAEAFASVAVEQGVGRIVYLGGITPPGESSEHLESRNEVAEILEKAGPEFVAIKTTMVVGAQSASFRTLAQIVDRLPVLALPTWRDTCTQPIALDDVVSALSAARRVEPGSYDVAGPDTLSIAAMIERIGELGGSSPSSFRLPFSSSKLESAAAAVVTDADRETLEPLFEGLHEDLVIDDNRLLADFGVEPTPFDDAAGKALATMAGEGDGDAQP